jgi:hypothetical protein
MSPLTKIGRLAVALAVLPLAAACAPAIGVAAGAAAAIALDERNASVEATANVAQATRATETAFGEMGITVTNRSSAADGTSAQLRGMHEGANVTVDIDSRGPNTSRIVVTAREGELGYRPSQAGRILERILARL